LVRRVGTTDGIARYDANLMRHQHVVCRRCGRMTDLQVPALASVRVAPRTIPGFVVEELDVRILGRCVRCAPGRSRRGRGRTHVDKERQEGREGGAFWKGTKPTQTRRAASAGESMANRRYLYFAKVADVEGYPEVAGNFRDTADGETGHAHGHLDYLKKVGD